MSAEADRREHDSLGTVTVPAGVLYGPHTVRAVENFHVSGITLEHFPDLLRALAEVKIAAARANMKTGIIDADIANAIVEAGREVTAGRWDDQFPIDLVQGGGGTPTNMNLNEVLAGRASQLLGSRPVHPNDHVNRSQSTNDVYPTAMCIAVHRRGLVALNDFGHLVATLERKAEQYGELQRLGRTCLQDAVPLSVRETHLAQAHAIACATARLRAAVDGMREVPLGATVIGSGIGATDEYRGCVVGYLAEETGLALIEAPNRFAALAHFDGHLSVIGALVQVMVCVRKLAADLRLLSSGPRAGLSEVTLPAVQVGSSIMPGKVNPVIPEHVMQICSEVRGAATVVEAAAVDGELELNIMEPVVARHILSSLSDAGRVTRLLADRCVAGLKWNADRLQHHVAASLGGLIVQSAREGYEAAVAIAKGA